MNHKHDVSQVLLKFGLSLTSLVGMSPLSKTMLIFEQFLKKPLILFFCFVCLFLFCESSRCYAYAWPWSGRLGVIGKRTKLCGCEGGARIKR